MKILLTGKDGQVGFELQRSLAPLGEVIAVDVAECDLSDAAALRNLIRSVRPGLIVHPAAYTAVDRAETDVAAADAVNAKAPGVIGEEAARIGAWVLHFSTDYVFDGTKPGPYTEEDTPNPQGIYGRSKRDGELALQASGARHLIFRTSWVAGAHGNNFVKTMLRLAAERDSLSVVADQFGVPTSAALLADLSALMVRETQLRGLDDFPFGLYHVVPAGETNWHEYACFVIDLALRAGKPIRIKPESIRAITTGEYPAPARRPANSRMDTSRFRRAFGLTLPPWQSGIRHILQQIA